MKDDVDNVNQKTGYSFSIVVKSEMRTTAKRNYIIIICMHHDANTDIENSCVYVRKLFRHTVAQKRIPANNMASYNRDPIFRPQCR